MTTKELAKMKGSLVNMIIDGEIHPCRIGSTGEAVLCVQDLATNKARSFPLDTIHNLFPPKPTHRFRPRNNNEKETTI
jgi:hypothetical protein